MEETNGTAVAKAVAERLLLAKRNLGKSYSEIAAEMGLTNVYVAQLFPHQAQLKPGTVDALRAAIPALSDELIRVMMEPPFRSFQPDLVQEPALYQSGVLMLDGVKDNDKADETLKNNGAETVWVEGLIPGIDFCNHDLKAGATWEVDSTGDVTGIPASMYLTLADQQNFEDGKEICISYGNKGNEELLYLYGFVLDNNPDGFLMVHYPMEALHNVPLSSSKAGLIEAQPDSFDLVGSVVYEIEQ